MTRAEYLEDFWDRFWRVRNHDIWKLERAQHFREPGYDVWEAFDEGDWPESMRRLEAGRAQIAADNDRSRLRPAPTCGGICGCSRARDTIASLHAAGEQLSTDLARATPQFDQDRHQETKQNG